MPSGWPCRASSCHPTFLQSRRRKYWFRFDKPDKPDKPDHSVVDYFASCVDTDDCRSRCLNEYTAFEAERQKIAVSYPRWSLGLLTAIDVPLESLLFSLDKGRHKPPFMNLDAVEMPSLSCRVCVARPSRVREQSMSAACWRAAWHTIACPSTSGSMSSSGQAWRPA